MLQRLQAGGVAPLQIVKQQDQRTALRGKGFNQRQHHMAEAGPGINGKCICREARFTLQQQPQLGHQAYGQLFISFQGAREADFPLRHLFRRQPEQVQRQGAKRRA